MKTEKEIEAMHDAKQRKLITSPSTMPKDRLELRAWIEALEWVLEKRTGVNV